MVEDSDFGLSTLLHIDNTENTFLKLCYQSSNVYLKTKIKQWYEFDSMHQNKFPLSSFESVKYLKHQFGFYEL
jgi:hypothetical protein